MSEKCKSTSPSAIQVKNRQKKISTEEKLRHKPTLNGEQIVNINHNVRFAQSSIHTICDDRMAESVKLGTKVFVEQDYHSPIRTNHTKNCACESPTYKCKYTYIQQIYTLHHIG